MGRHVRFPPEIFPRLADSTLTVAAGSRTFAVRLLALTAPPPPRSHCEVRTMPDRQALEALFLRNLGWIERALASVCRRYGVSRDDAEDFASWAKLKLVEDDYAVLGKFRDESSITTYLTVVIAMLFRDYRVQRWGRWRPSADARRRGPVP